MSEIDPLIQEFPPSVREHLRRAWDRTPEAARGPLIRALRELPGDLGRWRELMRLALSHVRLVTGDKRRVAIVGPANVGKTTLYNQLVRSPADRAEVSAVPGTTRVSRAADAGLFAAVDTPGADAVGAVGEAEKEQAFAASREADFLVIVFDAIQGIKRAEQGLPGEHHFYLSFRTADPGVVMSKSLRAQYPEEMTIVLQHQFWDLDVGDEAFSVSLRFGGARERLTVPFAALSGFADPAARFGLRFDASPAPTDEEEQKGAGDAASAAEPPTATGASRPDANVVDIAAFRKP